jgi:hypothetical protein
MPSRIDRFGGKRNYQHIGRVTRGIMRGFIASGGADLTTRQLMGWTHARALHQGRSSYRERNYYAKDIRRAADRLAIRVGRRWPDGIIWRRREATS